MPDTLLAWMNGFITEMNWLSVLKTSVLFALFIFAFGSVLRAIFGKGSGLTRSISSSINILLIYITAIAIYAYVPSLRQFVHDLPFILIADDHIVLYSLQYLGKDQLFSFLLQLSLLAFFVNLMEFHTPNGRRVLSWYFYRVFSCFISYMGYSAVCFLLKSWIPQLFTDWAMPVLLIFWGVIILSFLLKFALSVLLSVFNPIIGGLYSFFFANKWGRQFSRSLLTTLFMCLIIFALNYVGFTEMYFSDITLSTYGIPSVIFLIVLYLFGKLL